MRGFLLLDTNVFLHAKSLHLVKWLPIVVAAQPAVDEVVLAIAPIVLDELERHKSGLATEGLRNRAVDAMRLLHRAFRTVQSGDADIAAQPGVKLRLLPHRRVVDGGDARFGDDQLLGSLRELSDSEPNAFVGVVTRDEGLQLRSRQRGHAVVALADSDWKARGPSYRRSPDVDIAVHIEGISLESGAATRIAKAIVAVPSSGDVDARLELHRVVWLAEEERRLGSWFHRNPDGVEQMARDELRRSADFATSFARLQRVESQRLSLKMAILNSGGVRLEELAVDPLVVTLGGRLLRIASVDARIGQVTGAVGPGYGINPMQTAAYDFTLVLDDSVAVGSHDLHVQYTFTADKLAVEEDFEASLLVSAVPPALRVSPSR